LKLRERAITGAKWSIIDNAANAGITFLVGLVLARLLSPSEFGVIGIVTIFINLFNTIASGGLDTALIRKNNTTDNDYNTTFYTNLIVSIALIGVTFAISPWLSIFFNEPIIASTLPLMSIILLINAFSLIQNTLLVKQIDFKTLAIISLSASSISGLIAIILAVYGVGIWSLVCQQIIRQTIISILLWIKGRWRPKFRFSIESFKELIDFSWKVLTANVINSLFRDAFLAVIGKVHTSANLGQYSRADQFKNVISSNLSLVVQRVSLPVLSEIQNDTIKLRNSFRKIIIYTAICSFTFGLLLLAVAKPLILVLIGEKWLPAVKYLQIMCLYAIIAPISILNSNLLNVLKRSDLFLKIELIKKIFFCTVIIIGIYFSIETMIWCAVIYYYIDYILTSWYSKKLVRYGIFEQVADLFPIFLICALISFIVWSITLLNLHNIITLTIQSVMSVMLYYVTYKVIKITEFKELKEIITKEIKKYILH